MNFNDYFNNLKEFKSKKEIINDINIIYNIKLTDNEYKKIINKLLEDEIIDKSSKKGRCSYISLAFLKSKNFSSGIKYYNSIIKNKIINNMDKSNIIFNKNDCIIEINKTEIFNV